MELAPALVLAIAAATTGILHCASEDPSAPGAALSTPTGATPAAVTDGARAAAAHPPDEAIAEPPASPASPAPVAAAAAAAAPAGMVDIPAGAFLMGSRMSHGSPEERPMHEVIVASFYLDKTEVTTEDYAACTAAGACSRANETHPFCNIKNLAERAKHPINCVDWHQADAYCSFAKKRLPTEREWEYAARGGAEQRRFSWGDEELDIEQRACYHHRGSCPVGSFPDGAFGLKDISGNVWEWTSSWFGTYPDEAKTGSYRVYRGGSWSRRFPKWLANTMRNRYLPEEWSASVGFRCALSKAELTCPADAEPKDGACVRARGKPLCEPAFAWNGDACTLGGIPTPAGERAASRLVDRSRGEDPGTTAASAPAASKADEPIAQTRTPQFDGDCQANWPKKPAAYKFSGATFHARNRPLEAAGCTRRDMGLTWTSACCPQ